MTKYRKNRLSTEMKREIADIIQNQLKDPRLGLASVTGVEVSGDLAHANVYFSCLGGQEQRAETGAVLGKSAGFIRSQLAARLNTRTVPELHFQPDTSIEYGMKIEKILAEVLPEDQSDTSLAEAGTETAGDGGAPQQK